MIPKFRAFDNTTGKIFKVSNIDFDEQEVFLDGWRFRNIDEVKLMQSTGLHDKNGVEIFEGDIVKMHYFYEDRSSGAAREAEEEIIGVVGIDVLGTYTECEGYKYYWLNCLELPEEELEVIGNIYENRELAEG